MILRQKMLPVFRVQPLDTEWERNQEPASGSDGELRSPNRDTDRQYQFPHCNESGAFPYKSGGVGVHTGGSTNSKRAFTLIELLAMKDGRISVFHFPRFPGPAESPFATMTFDLFKSLLQGLFAGRLIGAEWRQVLGQPCG
jgi:hypothetical protein